MTTTAAATPDHEEDVDSMPARPGRGAAVVPPSIAPVAAGDDHMTINPAEVLRLTDRAVANLPAARWGDLLVHRIDSGAKAG